MIAIPKLAYSTVYHRLVVNHLNKVKITKIKNSTVYGTLENNKLKINIIDYPTDFPSMVTIISKVVDNDREYYQYLDKITKNIYDYYAV